MSAASRGFSVAGWILLCQAAGILGSFFTRGALLDWYPSLIKPALNPPHWIFAPVWTILYTLMGISAFLIYEQRQNKKVSTALLLFFVQLFLNVLWSFLFFGLRSPWGAMLDLAVLWLLVGITMFVFFKLSQRAGWLMFPYFIWLSFAGFLNYSLAVLNSPLK